MSSSIDPFDIDLGSDNDNHCSGWMYGWVLNVKKCVTHNHYIYLTSEGDNIQSSTTNTNLTAGTDLNLTATTGNISLASGADLNFTIGGNWAATVMGNIDITSNADNISLHSKLWIRKIARSGTLDDCIVGGMVDMEKLAAWIIGY